MPEGTAQVAETETDAGAAIAFLRELIAAQADGEAQVQQIIADRLAAAGCDVTTHDYDPGAVPAVAACVCVCMKEH